MTAKTRFVAPGGGRRKLVGQGGNTHPRMKEARVIPPKTRTPKLKKGSRKNRR